MRILPARVLAAAFAATLLAAPVHAQADKPVAKVGDITITEADLAVAADDLGDRLPATLNPDQRRDYLVGYVADLKLGARAAEAAKMNEAPDFERRVAYFRDKVLLDQLLTREAQKAVTPEAAKKLYEDTVKEIKPEEEVRARHILVKEEDLAKKVRARVAGGEDFAKVAAELSIDPGSGKEGGDLGYFTKERMVPAFSEAAFSLKPGEISQPVQSQFGWHVIKVEDKRAKPLPTFDEVKSQIDEYLVRKAQQDLIVSLREKNKVERLDKPAAPASPPAASPAAPATPADPKK